MSAPTNGYTVRLVYYGRADLMKKDVPSQATPPYPTYSSVNPKVSTQNIRIVPFSYDAESFPEIAIYELVKNEAPGSEATKNPYLEAKTE